MVEIRRGVELLYNKHAQQQNKKKDDKEGLVSYHEVVFLRKRRYVDVNCFCNDKEQLNFIRG